MKTDGFWLPGKTRSETKVRIGGTAVLIGLLGNDAAGDEVRAAIAAAGLLQLGGLTTDAAKGHFYREAGRWILTTLCRDWLATADPRWEGILKGGVYHLHKNLGVNESVMWGEYFFLEALERALTAP